jgi:two-component system sensor histidine kinase/response regulator
VRPVPSGKLALQAAAIAPPDLILLDINMPEMNGFEVCDALKQDEQLMDIPVIFVSALDEVFDKVRAFSVGGVDYITKPFQVEEVLARVRTHLALRRTQQQLSDTIVRMRELEKMRESMVQMIVHDLKSPLWGIEFFMEKLADQTYGRVLSKAEVQLGQVQAAASDLARMVNGLLDVSRIESSSMPVTLEDADLQAVVAQAVANVRIGEPSRSVEAAVEPGTAVRCDVELVRRVVENLVGNGLKHTPKGTPLRIGARRTDTGQRVEITDKGEGVPAALKEKIFDKFVTHEVRRGYHSSGLGLAFCRLAVQAHGGSIGVDDAPGGGSTFWFELPHQTDTTGAQA